VYACLCTYSIRKGGLAQPAFRLDGPAAMLTKVGTYLNAVWMQYESTVHLCSLTRDITYISPPGHVEAVGLCEPNSHVP
jgi:hypothetical protein